eukprot:CAMPEP_0198560754 /NCGR_PEP_ID=MMETSP1462-20131121/94410_1 /TAXON_ID=1333877 /ORGANISM="Brandtodinium nutriculum, Strain RCC3387" /LENGTH=72 /DNA_ID=CAMNT_0044291627 /DNA_START=35 /DNA_END=253 /DNA_ORIENTATION=+
MADNLGAARATRSSSFKSTVTSHIKSSSRVIAPLLCRSAFSSKCVRKKSRSIMRNATKQPTAQAVQANSHQT